mgnify:CR=1 FL=1
MDLNKTTTPKSEQDLAQTPKWFVLAAEELLGFKFELDVCASPGTKKCKRFYSQDKNGLTRTWRRYNWCNPPYSDITPWLLKAHTEARRGNFSCLLIPDKPEVKYVRLCRYFADSIFHMPFRLNFLRPDNSEFLDKNGKKQGPKFPVMLALFTPWGISTQVRDIYIDFREHKNVDCCTEDVSRETSGK